jgi:nucleotide-binding universal stress UspA family protein
MRVLLATDGSPSAGCGVDLVAGIEWPAGTTIRVVEAIETGVAMFGGPPALAMIQTDTLEEEVSEVARETVENARERLSRPGVEADAAVLRGRPAAEIVDAARAMQADTIVIGSRGHGTIESMLLGSVSAEVVDHATVPVLVARAPTLARVVLAWDGSSGARAAADLLRTWPIFAGSAIRVVSVASVEIPWWTGYPLDGSPQLLPIYDDAVSASRSEHDELARKMTTQLQSAGLEAEADRRDGDAAAELIAAAREWKADLIVMGTRGRTGLTRLVLGSVARNVLHHAPCSVLVVREQSGRG